jgi:hypothetical protein
MFVDAWADFSSIIKSTRGGMRTEIFTTAIGHYKKRLAALDLIKIKELVFPLVAIMNL